MGANASKVARKLPTKAQPETLKKIPTESPATLQAQIEAASELKSDFIEQDSRDPHLDQHLKAIGTVNIPPTITKMRTSDAMLGIVRERKIADEKYSKTGTISIDAIYSLLEERKQLEPGEADLPQKQQQWIKKYNLDQDSLSTILKYYSTVAVMPIAAGDKEDRRAGVWVTDKVDWERKVKLVEENNKRIEKAKKKALEDNNRAKAKNENQNTQEKKLKDLFEEDL